MTNWPVATPVATPLNAIQAEQVCGHAPTPVKQGGYMVVLGDPEGVFGVPSSLPLWLWL